MHESKDLEGRPFGEENASSDILSNHTGLIHEIGTISPTKAEIRVAHPAMMVNLPNEKRLLGKEFHLNFWRTDG